MNDLFINMDSYTIWTILLGFIWVIAYLSKVLSYKKMLLMGLVLLPFGLTQAYFVPGFWHVSVNEQFSSIRDIGSFLWIFFLGGIAAVLFESVFRLRKSASLKPTKKSNKNTLIIYFLLIISGVIATAIQWFTSLSVTRGALIMGFVIIWYVGITERKMLREVVYGALLFGSLYIMSLYVVDWLFPQFLTTHLSSNQTLGYILTIPIEEYLYAIVFGAACVPIYRGLRSSETK